MIIILALVVIVLALALLIQQRKILKDSQTIDDLKSEIDDVKLPGLNIIQSAARSADEILSQAELQSLKIPTEKALESTLFEDQINQKLNEKLKALDFSVDKIFEDFKFKFQNSISSSQQKQDQFIQTLENRSLEFESTIQNQVTSKVNSLLLDFEEKITDFFTGAQKQSLDAINLEITSARELIDSYKSQQLAIVDENVIAVLEQTLNLVLEKKLTLKDQIDLVYEALEKAKLEKFLV